MVDYLETLKRAAPPRRPNRPGGAIPSAKVTGTSAAGALHVGSRSLTGQLHQGGSAAGEDDEDDDLGASGLAAFEHCPPPGGPIPWEGPRGGDAVLAAAIAILQPSEWLRQAMRRGDGKALWEVAATHLPGRTPTECQERWRALNRMRAGPAKAAAPSAVTTRPSADTTKSSAPPTGSSAAALATSASHEDDSVITGYRCGFPQCVKTYKTTDAVRKHCRHHHPKWLRGSMEWLNRKLLLASRKGRRSALVAKRV